MSELSDKIADEYRIPHEDRVFLTGETEIDLREQAERVKSLTANIPPRFAFNPGQAAGNGTPGKVQRGVEAGRNLYRQNNKRGEISPGIERGYADTRSEGDITRHPATGRGAAECHLRRR